MDKPSHGSLALPWLFAASFTPPQPWTPNTAATTPWWDLPTSGTDSWLQVCSWAGMLSPSCSPRSIITSSSREKKRCFVILCRSDMGMNGCVPISKHCGNFIWRVPARGGFRWTAKDLFGLLCWNLCFSRGAGWGETDGPTNIVVLDKSHGEMWSRLSVNTTHGPLAAPSPAVHHLTRAVPQPHGLTHPPQLQLHTPLHPCSQICPISTHRSPKMESCLSWEVPFSVPEPLAVEEVSLLVLINKESATGWAFPFKRSGWFMGKALISLQGRADWKFQEERKKRPLALSSFSVKTLPCSGTSLWLRGVRTITTLFLSFNYLQLDPVPCPIHLPNCPDLTHDVLFCVHKVNP